MQLRPKPEWAYAAEAFHPLPVYWLACRLSSGLWPLLLTMLYLLLFLFLWPRVRTRYETYRPAKKLSSSVVFGLFAVQLLLLWVMRQQDVSLFAYIDPFLYGMLLFYLYLSVPRWLSRWIERRRERRSRGA
ncbi:hypothetical protein J31TS4_23530 [Paenibacillus sp. J31TS4]|uniref:hypothetical protein n=1 Tax=Paenibacillus sp. J31TS4 TaxID=2807195 RepID=UPI001B2B17C4|nr:hypothetical protein [Paenibacillus sp. J31TS4]GIP39073.1 hypothetical protein J31TS4_23530 [Paenibacillus sp. J31TS4]